MIGQPVGMSPFPRRGDWSVGGSVRPDGPQRSGLLSVSAAQHKGRTVSRSCPEAASSSSQTSPFLIRLSRRRESPRSVAVEVAAQPQLDISSREPSERRSRSRGESDGRSGARSPGFFFFFLHRTGLGYFRQLLCHPGAWFSSRLPWHIIAQITFLNTRVVRFSWGGP